MIKTKIIIILILQKLILLLGMEILKHVETVMLVKVIGLWLMILISLYVIKTRLYPCDATMFWYGMVKMIGICSILGALLAEFVYWYFVKL